MVTSRTRIELPVRPAVPLVVAGRARDGAIRRRPVAGGRAGRATDQLVRGRARRGGPGAGVGPAGAECATRAGRGSAGREPRGSGLLSRSAGSSPSFIDDEDYSKATMYLVDAIFIWAGVLFAILSFKAGEWIAT